MFPFVAFVNYFLHFGVNRTLLGLTYDGSGEISRLFFIHS